MASMKSLKDGKVKVQWYDSSGVRHRMVHPKKEAQELYDQVCAQRLFEQSGISPTLGIKAKNIRKLKFKEVAVRYRNEHLIPLTRAGSNTYYVDILIHKWGEYTLSMIDICEFKKWIRFSLTNPIPTPKHNKWKLSQLAASSVKKLVRYMTRVYYWAMQEKIISHNPLANIIPRKDPLNKEFRRQSKFKPVVLTLDEFWPLVDSFPDFVKNPSIACNFSGIRRGELAKIRWSKTNRKEHCFEYDADELKEANAKKVYYDAELESILEAIEIDYITNGYNDDIVFRSEKKRALTEDSFTHSVRYYCDLYAGKTGNDKYRKVTPHTFRRSYRTRKDREGADGKAVNANMGHSSNSMDPHYNIVDENRQKAVAGNISNCTEDLRKAIDLTIDTAKSSGCSLTDIQSELRQAWRAVGNFGHR